MFVASGSRVLSRLLKRWPYADTDHFYGKVRYEKRFHGKFEDFGRGTGIYSWFYKYMQICKYKRSMSFFDLWPKTLIVWQFQKSSKMLVGKLYPNFMYSLLGLKEQSFVQIVQVLLPIWSPCELINKILLKPTWPPCPYMVKAFKNLLLQNQFTDGLKTWYVTSGTRVLTGLFKWCPQADLNFLRQGQIWIKC